MQVNDDASVPNDLHTLSDLRRDHYALVSTRSSDSKCTRMQGWSWSKYGPPPQSLVSGWSSEQDWGGIPVAVHAR